MARAEVLSKMVDHEARQTAIKNLIDGFSAASSRPSSSTRWNTWVAFDRVMAEEGEEPLPLTADKIVRAAACFKEGGYRSFRNFLSKAKEMHILAGHEWNDLLRTIARKATLSVERGMGPPRQSAPFDLDELLAFASTQVVCRTVGAPIGWSHLLVIGTFFVMREIEIAAALAVHVRIDTDKQIVFLRLPASKTDVTGVGCTRSWACLCREGRRRPACPYHAAIEQLALLKVIFGEPLTDTLPLFPVASGNCVEKKAVIRTLEATLLAAGQPTTDDTGAKIYGGHSFRVSGARMLASLGVDIAKIMVLARWASDAVLRYVRDAPLDTLPSEVAFLMDQRNAQAQVQEATAHMEAEHDDLKETVAALRARMDEATAVLARVCAPPPACKIIAKHNGRKKKAHEAMVDGTDAPPQQWRTRCGRPFADWVFTRHADVAEFPEDFICRACFPGRPEQQAPELAAPEHHSSSGDSASDTEGTDNSDEDNC